MQQPQAEPWLPSSHPSTPEQGERVGKDKPGRGKAVGQLHGHPQRPPCASQSHPKKPLAGPEWAASGKGPPGAVRHLQVPVPGAGSSFTPRPRSLVSPGGSFPAPRGQPRACWAELSWRSQPFQGGLPFLNPEWSDRGKKESKERTNGEREAAEGQAPAAGCDWPLGMKGSGGRLRPRDEAPAAIGPWG